MLKMNTLLWSFSELSSEGQSLCLLLLDEIPKCTGTDIYLFSTGSLTLLIANTVKCDTYWTFHVPGSEASSTPSSRISQIFILPRWSMTTCSLCGLRWQWSLPMVMNFCHTLDSPGDLIKTFHPKTLTRDL